jgi:hypothetical protein
VVSALGGCGSVTGLQSLTGSGGAAPTASTSGTTTTSSTTTTTGSGDASGTCSPVSGLLAYYPLDGDTLDHSGNGNDAVAKNLTPAPGKIGGAYVFNGVDSSLQATGSSMLNGARTFCAWVCWDDAGAAQELGEPIFSAGVSGAGPSGTGGDFFCISPSSPKSWLPPPDVPFIDHGETSGSNGAEIRLSPGVWSFVCYVYDGAGGVTFYGDGTSVPAGGAEYDYPLATLFIGSQSIGGTSTRPSLLGTLDEVTVWSRALDASDLASLWNGGAGCAAR